MTEQTEGASGSGYTLALLPELWTREILPRLHTPRPLTNVMLRRTCRFFARVVPVHVYTCDAIELDMAACLNALLVGDALPAILTRYHIPSPADNQSFDKCVLCACAMAGHTHLFTMYKQWCLQNTTLALWGGWYWRLGAAAVRAGDRAGEVLQYLFDRHELLDTDRLAFAYWLRIAYLNRHLAALGWLLVERMAAMDDTPLAWEDIFEGLAHHYSTVPNDEEEMLNTCRQLICSSLAHSRRLGELAVAFQNRIAVLHATHDWAWLQGLLTHTTPKGRPPPRDNQGQDGDG